MTGMLKIGFMLALFCGIAAGLLQSVHSITQPIIKENERLAAIKKRQEVLSDAVTFIKREIAEKSIWIGKDKDSKTTGYIIEVSPRGYSGKIKTTIGIGLNYLINKVAINKLDQSETPGLGTKVTTKKFKEQFNNKKGIALKLKKDGGDIDAITSATISSRAVANGINKGIDWFNEHKDALNE